MALMGAEILFYPTAIANEPQDPTLISKDHWQRTMQGHAAANMVPLVSANRIGQEHGEALAEGCLVGHVGDLQQQLLAHGGGKGRHVDRKSTRLNSSH